MCSPAFLKVGGTGLVCIPGSQAEFTRQRQTLGRVRSRNPSVPLRWSLKVLVSSTRLNASVEVGNWDGYRNTNNGMMAPAVLLRMGPRKQPPHYVEVKAAEQNVSKLRHEVYLPNDTNKVSTHPAWCLQRVSGCRRLQDTTRHPSTLFAHVNRSIFWFPNGLSHPHCSYPHLGHIMPASILQASMGSSAPSQGATATSEIR